MGTKKSGFKAQHNFAQTPSVSLPRSTFDRSHGVKTTFDAGFLIPILRDEVLPGDTVKMTMSHFARLATPIFPIMDNMHITTFFFFVPNRLVWNNWERFNGAQDDPGDSTDFTVPFIIQSSGTIAEQSLGDYLGLPTGIALIDFSAMYHRAYALIWNQWFRDENLQDSILVNKDDGPDGKDEVVLQRRGKRHDYFSSCLPTPQKGDAVTIGIGGSAPVAFTTQSLAIDSTSTAPTFTCATSSERTLQNLDTGGNAGFSGVGPSTPENVHFGAVTGLEYDPLDITTGTADLSSATAVTINALRQAFQIQVLLERDMRGGTRYIETIRSHFGVTSPDQRLQRSQYLGGSTSLLRLSAVPQTSETDGTPQGTLAAFGVSSGTHHGFTQSFTEHGMILGLVCLHADLNYQEGMHRDFNRRTRYDFYWPAFANLGEQAVLNKEIYARGVAADDLVFGYQENYADYRYKPSIITGKMRSQAAGTLDSWHLAQDFSVLPVLDDTFIQENPPLDRCIAIPSEPHLIYDGFFKYSSTRVMPVHGIPGIGSRF